MPTDFHIQNTCNYLDFWLWKEVLLEIHRTLPVTMTVLILASRSLWMAGFVSGLSLFCRTIIPRNVMLNSTLSLKWQIHCIYNSSINFNKLVKKKNGILLLEYSNDIFNLYLFYLDILWAWCHVSLGSIFLWANAMTL